MANDIHEKQNDPAALRLLVAQRHLYNRAKAALTGQIILVVVIPGVLLLVEYFQPGFKVWAAFAGLTLSAIDVAALEPLKSALQEKAAAMQEAFDCRVLDLDWPILKGTKPDREEASSAPTPAELDVLRNWYPVIVGEMPKAVARLICQRSNCWWDSRLRRFYWTTLVGMSALISLAIVGIAVVRNLPIHDLVLSLMAPVRPVVLWMIREAKRQQASAKRVHRLKLFGDDLWERTLKKSITPEKAALQSRLFQDELFDHRRTSPLIFGWFYWLFRNAFESRMRYGAAEMVATLRSNQSTPVVVDGPPRTVLKTD